jgi:hypothetical protein
LPVIISAQNEAIRLLGVLLSHQCLEIGLQFICLVVAACGWLFAITHYPGSISVKSLSHESLEEYCFLLFHQICLVSGDYAELH